MCAVYAFMRYCDDIADDPERAGATSGACWRSGARRSTARPTGSTKTAGYCPAFHDTVRKFGIPLEYFHQLIDGASMDLSIERYETFDQLYDYCYKVASVVGLVCIHIFGFDSPEAKKYAEYCGIAFQLTNILRDLREDASMGRVYLPEEDLWAFDYSADDLMHRVQRRAVPRLMRFEVDRARGYYNAALPLLQMVHGSGRPGLCAMIEIYSGILEKIEKSHYDVFSSRISLSTSQEAIDRGEDAAEVAPERRPAIPASVAVIGGGVAGLACACELVDAGCDVTLLEAANRLGGRARSFRDKETGELIDNCQHVILGCCEAAAGFLEKIGSLDQVEFADTIEFVGTGGERLRIRASLAAGSIPPAPIDAADRLPARGREAGAGRAALAGGHASAGCRGERA